SAKEREAQLFTKLVNDVSSDSELAQISSDANRALPITKLLTAEPAPPSRPEADIETNFDSVKRKIIISV
ncbi:transcriptional regulator, partial [Pseudoalteromonas sp. S1649]